MFEVIIVFGIYFMPTIFAVWNNKNVGKVFVLNLFLGWTFLAWVIAFIMAV